MSMKYVASVVAILLALNLSAPAQTLDDLKNDGKNTDNVLTYGMGYHQHRYSTLKQIDKTNIKRLVPVWNLSLDNQWGEQAQPLVYNGVMYVTNARATVAVDLASGRQLWRTPVDWLPETPRVVCCGVSNKGAAILNGKLFRTTLDAHVVALDMKTGKEIWKTKAAEWKDGYSMTVAPQIADGVLITGISGAEFGIRGFIDGWDPETGKQLWRRYTIPARGEKGNETWAQDTNAWEIGGGSSWITGSYDPELDLTYWGVGNPAPWASQSRPGDNLFTSSVLALRPKTGEVVWHYQFTPNDPFDFDANWEMILADIDVEGAKRKVLMQLNRNGFLYVLDRANGQLIAANPYEKVNWATHIDLKTGRPVETDVATKVRAGEQVEMWPSTRGGKNWPHAAYNPETGLLYANTMHRGGIYKHLETKPYVAGQRYQFIENRPTPVQPGEAIGHVDAIDPLTGKPRWRAPLTDHPHWSAMLATGSGLLFTGKMTGEFIALDADSGKTLWQFQTGSGVNAMPITFTQNGRQYVTVLSGVGGLWWNAARQQLSNVPQGGSVWTFALLPD
jgi:alcohol dehydrogenase (cytochrome c)